MSSLIRYITKINLELNYLVCWLLQKTRYRPRKEKDDGKVIWCRETLKVWCLKSYIKCKPKSKRLVWCNAAKAISEVHWPWLQQLRREEEKDKAGGHVSYERKNTLSPVTSRLCKPLASSSDENGDNYKTRNEFLECWQSDGDGQPL